ncbi:Hypothetical protein ACI5QL_00343 [Bacillus velezensis]
MPFELIESVCACADKVFVCKLFVNADFDESVCQGGVCAGLDFQVKIGYFGRRRFPGSMAIM